MFSVTSLGFLPFMALFVCLWYRVPQPSRWKLVLEANAVFCLSIDIGAFFAVALATAVVWQAAQHAQPEQPSRRGWLALGLAAALLPLLVLKYSGMLVPGLRDLYKPFGLAYYSLQLAGYLLDVWHGRTAPTSSYARLWCYAGFFLSLTQGPFNRYNTLMPQLEAAPKTFETQRLVSGLQRSAWGYFKKFAIADRAAIVVSAAFADPASFDRSQLILPRLCIRSSCMPIFPATRILCWAWARSWACTCRKTSASRFFLPASRSCGPGGISAFRSGSGIMCISHWAATARALPGGMPTCC